MNVTTMPVIVKACPLLLLWLITTTALRAQVDTFDVYTYKVPPFFTRSILPARVQLSMTNNDTSTCLITLYSSTKAGKNLKEDLIRHWNEQVVKRLARSSKKPLQVMKESLQDGWTSTLAIGNYYQGPKKSVVMLQAFRKDNRTACIVMAFSDKIFKGPIESFSANSHLLP